MSLSSDIPPNCCDLNAMVCGEPKNNFTSRVVIGAWIVTIYFSWAVWALSIAAIIIAGPDMSTYDVLKSVMSLVAALMSLILQQVAIWGVVNVYNRFTALEARVNTRLLGDIARDF